MPSSLVAAYPGIFYPGLTYPSQPIMSLPSFRPRTIRAVRLTRARFRPTYL